MKIAIRITQRGNGVYRASCPALPGCIVHGKSKEEMKPKIVGAVAGYLASLDVALSERVHDVIALMPEDDR